MTGDWVVITAEMSFLFIAAEMALLVCAAPSYAVGPFAETGASEVLGVWR
jgi:hypothetical protein